MNRHKAIFSLFIAGLFLGPAAAQGAEPIPAKVTGKWAHPKFAAPIYKQPSITSGSKKRLRLRTEDGFPEVYAVYQHKIIGQYHWIRIGIPARPNGQRGWVRKYALGSVQESHQELRINRKNFTAKLWEARPNRKMRLVWQARVGVGAPGTETPGGRFWIRERIRGFQTGTIYGYMAFGTSAYSKLSDWPGGGVVGIHGTNQPELIPGAVSHGCVRVRNKKIYKLSKHLRVGTPVRIR